MPLFQLGGVQFDVTPTNVHEVERETTGDYAAKEIIGAQPPREFMGPGDERVTLKGRIFPKHFGGLGDLETLLAMPASGEPQILVRGDGTVFGWYFVLKVRETSKFLARDGVGHDVEFEIDLVSSPASASEGAIGALLGTILGAIASLF